MFINKDQKLIIGLYVDDILVLGANKGAIDQVIKGISAI